MNTATTPPADSATTTSSEGELILYMQQLFLDGLDTTFDYSKIDESAALDDHVAMGHDVEEAYFYESEGEELMEVEDWYLSSS